MIWKFLRAALTVRMLPGIGVVYALSATREGGARGWLRAALGSPSEMGWLQRILAGPFAAPVTRRALKRT